MKALFDRIFLTRPIVLIPSWAFLLAGYLRAHERNGLNGIGAEILIPFLLLTSLLAGAYVINQIYDRDTDRENGKLFLIAEGHVPLRDAWIEAVVLMALPLVLSVFLFRECLLWLVISALLGLLYSVDPIRLKGRPVLDLLANAVGYGGVTFLFGYSIVRPVGMEEVLQSVPYMVLVAAVFLHTALVDRAGDEKTGLRTSATLIGERALSIVATVFLLLAFLSGWKFGEPYPTLAAIGASPFFLWAVVFPGKNGSSLSFQWGSLLFILPLFIRVPLFGLLLIVLLLLTRLYYRLRFHIIYPKLDF